MASNATKNSMPSFAQGSYKNILKLIADEKVNAPAFIYFTDRECLGFYDSKKNLHTILWEQVADIKNEISTINTEIADIQQSGATIMLTSDGGDE